MIERLKSKIDDVNRQDPNLATVDGKDYPKELIYGQRMSEMLHAYNKNPSLALQIATHGQHIKRWAIPRSDYPMDRKGYLKWRTTLKMWHGKLLTEILEEEGLSQTLIDQVRDLVTKKRLKNDPETQQLEDVACLVFLKYYFSDFAQGHEEEKVCAIVRKTWAKMTAHGHALALKLNYEASDLAIIQKALR